MVALLTSCYDTLLGISTQSNLRPKKLQQFPRKHSLSIRALRHRLGTPWFPTRCGHACLSSPQRWTGDGNKLREQRQRVSSTSRRRQRGLYDGAVSTVCEVMPRPAHRERRVDRLYVADQPYCLRIHFRRLRLKSPKVDTVGIPCTDGPSSPGTHELRQQTLQPVLRLRSPLVAVVGDVSISHWKTVITRIGRLTSKRRALRSRKQRDRFVVLELAAMKRKDQGEAETTTTTTTTTEDRKDDMVSLIDFLDESRQEPTWAEEEVSLLDFLTDSNGTSPPSPRSSSAGHSGRSC